MNLSKPLRRTTTDVIVAAVIAVVAIALFLGAWFTAPIRSTELTPAAVTYAAQPIPAQPPRQVSEVFSLEHAAPAGVFTPVVTNGVVITYHDNTLRAHDPTGQEVWSYVRAEELCSLGAAWNKVVATYRTNVGCGDVVSIDAATGQYDGTRSAIASADPVAIASNDRIGILGTDRVELWRSDMVRTVEYGAVEAPQEPDMQPYPHCTITSALTRQELLAVTENCPDDPSVTWLRYQDTTPEDSRKPELSHNISLPHPDARLVAISQDASVSYLPGATPTLITMDTSGQETERREVSTAPMLAPEQRPWAPMTADLPHHMTWFDGDRLYLFRPGSLTVDVVIENAIGTGIALGDRLVYPLSGGLAVADWNTGFVETIVPVDRGEYTGPVGLDVIGQTIVEQRGERIVGLNVDA